MRLEPWTFHRTVEPWPTEGRIKLYDFGIFPQKGFYAFLKCIAGAYIQSVFLLTARF